MLDLLQMGKFLNSSFIFLDLRLKTGDGWISLFKFWGVASLADFIYINCSLDMLCFLTEMERVDCLLVIRQSLGHCANDSSSWVTSKWWLQNASHLWVSVVNELLRAFSLAKLVDHIRQGKQAAIDVGTFTQSKTVSLCLAHTLTAGQVNQVKLGNPNLLFNSSPGLTLEINPEYRVGTTWSLVQFGLSNISFHITFDHVVQDLGGGWNIFLCESVYVNSFGNALTDLKVLVCWSDQIIDALVVYLQVIVRILLMLTSMYETEILYSCYWSFSTTLNISLMLKGIKPSCPSFSEVAPRMVKVFPEDVWP